MFLYLALVNKSKSYFGFDSNFVVHLRFGFDAAPFGAEVDAFAAEHEDVAGLDRMAEFCVVDIEQHGDFRLVPFEVDEDASGLCKCL